MDGGLERLGATVSADIVLPLERSLTALCQEGRRR
jgi:hypothetical protein